MGTKRYEDRFKRTIFKSGSGSYSITLPIHLVRELKWRETQGVTVRKNGKQLIIEDAQ